ncbi:MAG: MmcQ/YjbR family DNA-binding protein [Bacteroidia bacterium]|nr:MmcQ/YjbR family DNA-binding protein [Bacteroidia bacterium]MBT8268558.1 MmcQ/YjbR family DNA-binding protein [Bacteroidia bacterium]NNF82112.1 MmcQ/YjbR family DNA-binding protein [Flavobacteriaceae bacterium]NNK70246.1 MmcQ/YjbR family DNA-binding protein [Flavobacteriaceae bacterium]NNL80369.1 MmcQ/YjbR family DNA-binding protein [Flavobacteriaceae bacterium]
MKIDQIRNHCLAKKGATEEFPFDQDTLVFKVLNKMFVIAPLDKWEKGEASVTLKCDPEYTIELRDRYESIYPGPYVSNKHWNTIDIYKMELKPEFILELIDHSYDMVVKGMPKSKRALLS